MAKRTTRSNPRDGGPEDGRARKLSADIGRALHDGTVPTLAAVLMLLEVLRRRALAEAPGLAAQVDYIAGLLYDESTQLRSLLSRLEAAPPAAARRRAR